MESWAYSQVEQEKFSFRWKLANYSVILKNGTMTSSPVFYGGSKSKHQWCLHIYPKKKWGDDGIEHFGLFLKLIAYGDGNDTDDRKLNISYQFTLMDEHDVPLPDTLSEKHECEFGKGGVYGVRKIITSANLAKLLPKNSMLQIMCEVWIDGPLVHDSGCDEMPLETKQLNMLMTLSNNVKSLLTSELLTDVVLCTPTKKFKAHKIILSCRSPVFAKMFETNMTEAKYNVVDIPDFSDNVVQEALEYMYSGTSENVSEMAPDLLQIAEKYDLGLLKSECENIIAAQLKVENAAECFILANIYSSILKRKVMGFISRNKRDVEKTEGFKRLSLELIAELYRSECN